MLDTQTLGGAGFASQRTVGEDTTWDLAAYDGIELDIVHADEKKYTFLVKDELLPKSPNGREQSTISWEYDFTANKDGEKLFVRWEDLKPTYRGKEKKDAEPLKVDSIKRISIMNRRYVHLSNTVPTWRTRADLVPASSLHRKGHSRSRFVL